MEQKPTSNSAECVLCTQHTCMLSNHAQAHLRELHIAITYARQILEALIPGPRITGQAAQEITRAWVTRQDVEVWLDAYNHIVP